MDKSGLFIVAPAPIVISVLSLTAPLIVFLGCAPVLRSLFSFLSLWRLLLTLLPLIILLLLLMLLLLPLVILLLLLMLLLFPLIILLLLLMLLLLPLVILLLLLMLLLLLLLFPLIILLLLLMLLLPLVILLLFMLLSLIILAWTSRRRRFLSSPLGRCGRSMFYLLLLIVPLNGLVPRLVTVALTAQLMLLLYLSWVAVSRVLPLVDGQRGARWS